MKGKALLFGTIAGYLLFTAVSANALVISLTGDSAGNPEQPTYQAEILQSDVGESFTLDWLVEAGTMGDSILPVDLSASVTFSIDGFVTDAGGQDTITLGIDIFNTTDLSGYPDANAAILSFGFGIDPDATASLLVTGSTFDAVDEGSGPNQTFPGGFKYVDVCIFADGCSGGNVNLGLQAGDSDSMMIQLVGDFDQGGTAGGLATLFDFPIKFQGTWGSFEVPGNRVPEPDSLALLGIALLGMGLANRRRKVS